MSKNVYKREKGMLDQGENGRDTHTHTHTHTHRYNTPFP